MSPIIVQSLFLGIIDVNAAVTGRYNQRHESVLRVA